VKLDRLLKQVGAAVLVLSGCASAALSQDSMKLVNAGYGNIMGGVYTSPYGVSINGGPSTLLICDDYTTNVNLNQTWNAYEATYAQLQAGPLPDPGGYNATLTPKWCLNSSGAPVYCGSLASTGVADVKGYAVAAVLAAELMALGNTDATTQGELSYALWNVFDPTLLNSANTGYGTLTTTGTNASTGQSGGQLGAAISDYNTALALVNAAGGANADLSSISISSIGTKALNVGTITGLTIYAPSPLSASQEFLKVQVSMPEPSYPAILIIDLMAVAGLALVFRKRIPGMRA
jgi:hypothetical protein